MASNFSDDLDDIFRVEGGLDSIVQEVETKRQSIFIQQRELEELQARIAAAEARIPLKDGESAESSAISTASKRRATNAARLPSVFAIAETTQEDTEPAPAVAKTPAKGTDTPVSTASNEYVVVRRPRPAPRKHPRVDSHIEVTSEENTEEDEEGSEEEESSEAGSSSEEEEDSEEEESSEEE